MFKEFIVRQEDDKDCGAACLSSIVKYYGGYVPYEIIKYDTLVDNNGTNFYNIKIAANKYGFNSVGIKEQDILTPYIAQTHQNGFNHFIVVYKKDKDKVIVMDPAIGIIKYSNKEFNEIFTGYMLKLTVNGKVVKYKKKNVIKEIIINNKDLYNKSILKIFIVTLVLILFNLINTYLMKETILNKKYISIFIIFSLLNIILLTLKNNLIVKLNKIINLNLINKYLTKYFNLPFKYLYLKSSGDITNRIKDLSKIKNYLSSEIINFLINIILFVFCIIILFCLNLKLTLFVLFIFIISLILILKINRLLIKEYNYQTYNNNEYMNKVCEYVNKIKTINYLNKNNFFINNLKELTNVVTENSYRIEKINNNINIIVETMNLLLIVIIVIVFRNENMNVLLTYFLYFNSLKDCINYFIFSIPNISYLKIVIKRILGVYYLENKSNYSRDKFINGCIEVKNLNYAIGNNKIISNLSFKIKKGDKVLIWGRNGTGKSTFLNILTKYIENYKGKILINNNNIENIDTNSFSDNVSYVNQNSSLFEDTFINNIIIDEKFDSKKFNNVIDIVGLNNFIKKNNDHNIMLKDNYSGGEKQKIILARNLYRDFKILILDEAFSEIAVDERKSIINKLNKIYKNKTIIYINHFDDNIRYDQIIRMDKDTRKDMKSDE